jgi:pimeloyl-ACP methyl ester carboxylesterase
VSTNRPRLLLVSGVSELEWRIKPQLEAWADVASFDPPGVGDSPGEWSPEASGDLAVRTADEREWDQFILVVDAWGGWYLPRILERRSEAIRGLAYGHAAVSARMTGDRPVRNPAVWDAFQDLITEGQEKFARSTITQFTQDGIDEAAATEIMKRVPMPVFQRLLKSGRQLDFDLVPLLRQLDVPLLFAQHDGCLLYTDEGYEDAVAAFPGAGRCVTEKTCSADPAFAEAIRDFAEEICGS